MAGNLEWGSFRCCQEWGYDYGWRRIFSPSDEGTYLDALKSVAGAFGILPEEINRLYERGFALEGIEDALYNREI